MRKKVFYEITIFELFKKKLMRQELAKYDLYFGQPPILKYIYRNEGCSQTDLANYLKVSTASVAISTKRLEKSGFLKKTLDDSNLRQKKLSLTEKGKSAAIALEEFFVGMDSRILQDISEEELNQVEATLEKMFYNLSGRSIKEINLHELIEEKSKEVSKK